MNIAQNACVSCMKVEDLFSIFETHVYEGIGRIEPFAEMLSETFSVEIDRSSDLKSACCSCILQMKGAAHFKKQILSTMEELKQLACLQIDYVEDDELIKVEHVETFKSRKDFTDKSNKEINEVDHLNKENEQIFDRSNASETVSDSKTNSTVNKEISEPCKTLDKPTSNVLNQVIVGKKPSEISIVSNTNKNIKQCKEKPKIRVLKQERIVPIIYKNGNIVIDASVADLPIICNDGRSINETYNNSTADKDADRSKNLVVDADMFENFVKRLDIKSLEFNIQSDISDDMSRDTREIDGNGFDDLDKILETDSDKIYKNTKLNYSNLSNANHIIFDSVICKNTPVKEIAAILNESCEIEISNQVNEETIKFPKDNIDEKNCSSGNSKTSETLQYSTETPIEKLDSVKQISEPVKWATVNTENMPPEENTHKQDKEISFVDKEHPILNAESEDKNIDNNFEINGFVENNQVDNTLNKSTDTVVFENKEEAISCRNEKDRSSIESEDKIPNISNQNINEEHSYVINNILAENCIYKRNICINNIERNASNIENEMSMTERNKIIAEGHSLISKSDVIVEDVLEDDNQSEFNIIYDHEYIFESGPEKIDDEIIPVVKIDGKIHSKVIHKPILATKEIETDKMTEEFKKSKKHKKSVRFLEDYKIKTPKSYFPMRKVFKLSPDQTECTICTKSFATRKKLYEHMHEHYPQFECEKCSKKFVSNKFLKRHMESHLEGPFVCVYCDKLFTKINSRNSHVWRVHKTATPFNCAECGQKFPTVDQRLKHMKESHGLTEPKYPCLHCEKKFFDSGSRSKHIRAAHETDRRRYKCSECPLKFDVFNALLNHLSTKHGIGEKNFECPSCQKKFFNVQTLKRHQKIHCKSCYEFQCHICGATFSYKAVLRCHIKGHEIQDQKQTCDININEQPIDDNVKKYIIIVND